MIASNWKVLIGFVLLFGQGATAADKVLLAATGGGKTQLVELYSSESCSSCPPADQWISGLKDNPDLWKKFVPVVFHVDYWNYLGWKDGFSSDSMTKRQIAISETWAKPSVYTPGFVLDGKEWSDWRKAVHHEIPATASKSSVSLKIYKETDGAFSVQVQGLKENQKMILHASQLGMDLVSKIAGGENSGAKLQHNFVVLDWQNKSVHGKNTEAAFYFKKRERKADRLAIAVWIEVEGNPTPVQAVGAYL